jgi:hypothetical protein
MIQYYGSGYITHRNRKTGIVFSGQTAEHIMDNFLTEKGTHPFRHVRIQQLAKQVKEWKKVGDKTYSGTISDTKTQIRIKIIAEIYPKFALIVTAFKV